MGFVNIYVSKDAFIYVKNSQLFFENKDKKIDYSLEDINSIMIENLNTTISTYSLSKFAEFGILVYICNQNHLPNGVVLPYLEHYQTLSQYEYQVAISKPLKKQMWQSIIKNKIKNQNDVLNMCGGFDVLKPYQEKVSSGDTGNLEATASLIYFKELFGKDFVRRDENVINTFLNFGYSIIRGAIARCITSHGLTPFLALFHSNSYNSFNLADDLIEPFRPIVDLLVKIKLSEEKEITPRIKLDLFNILNIDVDIEGQKQTVSNAIELFVQSYIRSLKVNKNLLKEIKIIGLDVHQYE